MRARAGQQGRFFTYRRSSVPSHLGLKAPSIMKGVVMQFRQSIILTVALLVMSLGLFHRAEATTIDAGHATVSWTGQGVIDDLGMGTESFEARLLESCS